MARYWRLLFGKPDDETRLAVESGRYPVVSPYRALLDVREGDGLILYCTNGYPRLRKVVWGKGTVTRVTLTNPTGARGDIYYKPLRFAKPLPRRKMLQALSPGDRMIIENATRPWVIEVSQEAFEAIVSP